MERKLNLCLHCGGHEATWDQVREAETPEATDTYQPIAHHAFVETVLETLGGSGLRVVEQAHALWKDGNRYFGSYQLANGTDHDDYALVVGLRNSHDKTFPAGIACGSGVFVCDNLAFSGEVRISRRHTARIMEDLPRLISTAVGRLGGLKANQEKRIEVYKSSEVSDLQAHDLLVRAVDAKALAITHIPMVLQHWRQPPHEAFQKRNAWSLFNAFTEDYKSLGADMNSRRSIALHGLFDQLCGLKVIEAKFEDAEVVGGVEALAV